MRANLLRVVLAGVILAVVFARPFSARWVVTIKRTSLDRELTVRRSNESEPRFRHVWVQNLDRDESGNLAGEREVVLRSSGTEIPGGQILSGDTTYLPGAFRIRVDGAEFVIQENRIALIEPGIPD